MQFDVSRGPGGDPAIPFVAQIQSSRLDRTSTRVVIALVRVTPASPGDGRVTPHFMVLGQAVHADPLNRATIPLSRLGAALTVRSDADADRIIAALDEMISRA